MFNRNQIRDHYPCNNYPDGACPNRHPGCQSKCIEMLAAQLVADERKKKERAAKAQRDDATGFVIDSRKRNRKKGHQI